MKSSSFTFSRLIHLGHKDIVENWRKYLPYVGTLFGMFLIFFIWRGYFVYGKSDMSGSTQDEMIPLCINFFIGALFIGGCISASLTMSNMRRKSDRISIFTLPATPLEKYIYRWLMYTVVFLLVLMISFKLADYIRVLVFSLWFPSLHITPASFDSLFTVSGPGYHVCDEITQVYSFFIGYFFLQSCMVLGSTIWPKGTFPKTFLALLIILTVFVGLLWITVQLFKPSEMVTQGVNIDLAEGTNRHIYWYLAVGLTLFNWTMGYYRFKETDIL